MSLQDSCRELHLPYPHQPGPLCRAGPEIDPCRRRSHRSTSKCLLSLPGEIHIHVYLLNCFIFLGNDNKLA